MISYKFLYFVLLFTIFGIIPHVTAEESVQINDNYKEKDGVGKWFGISGKTSYDNANMTVIYPDESTVKSSLTVTDNGYFQTFVSLYATDPAGLYTVVINPYNATTTDTTVSSSPLNTSFFMPDFDGMIDIRIPRNSML